MKKRIELLVFLSFWRASLFAQNESDKSFEEFLVLNRDFFIVLMLTTLLLVYIFFFNKDLSKHIEKYIDKIKPVLISILFVVIVVFLFLFALDEIDAYKCLKIVITIATTFLPPLFKNGSKGKEIKIEVKDSENTIIQIGNTTNGNNSNVNVSNNQQ